MLPVEFDFCLHMYYHFVGMKPVQIRKPLIKALKKLDVDVSKIPHNMISHYVRRIKKVVDNKICDWVEIKLYRTNDLDTLANNFIQDNIDKYATILKRTLREDSIAA